MSEKAQGLFAAISELIDLAMDDEAQERVIKALSIAEDIIRLAIKLMIRTL